MMKKCLSVALVGLISASALLAQTIQITSEPTGFIIEKDVNLQPSKSGVVLSREVALPAFEKGAYYRPFSGGVANGNRVEAVAFNSLVDLQGYKPSKTRYKHNSVQRGQFILLQINEGQYLSIIPMLSSEVSSEFFLENAKLTLRSSTYGTEDVAGDVPLLLWAYGDSPYAATHAAWNMVIESGFVAADWRSNKEFPVEPYGYLGWCSWEFYKTRISSKILVDAVHTIEANDAPIRWLMVDNGYLTQKNSKIINFTPDVKKFPNGWEELTSLKNPDGIKWMGVWRNMLGFMGAISPEHTMTDLTPNLMPSANGKTMLPKDNAAGAKAFYEKMVKDSKESGFDFTKVDFQSRVPEFYKGTANAVRATRYNNEALEAATKKYDMPLLNCIAQPNINSFQTKYSVVTRSSPDYNQADKDKNKCNTYQSFANHLWMSQTVWGDLDMFHTHDERDVQSMSVARAISGGPVYISDEPNKIVAERLIPFAYEDGLLLRTQAPATLLPESFFIHPFRDAEVFRVIAPLEDKVAAIALFNFSEVEKPLVSSISAKDYPYAGELLQPSDGPWTQPEEGLLVYDQAAQSVVSLDDDLTAEVESFGAKLFLLYPKTQGWAVIGRTDKYLPSAAVKVQSVSNDQVVFTLHESGPLAIWSDQGAPKMKGATFELIGENLYLADLPIEAGAQELTVTR
ncbi:Sip1-related alpha-galactosidase [Coraliomargarita algicola]|uniref:Sip1-related alpha-galactosidase n=1 Tax=Coraliomargarita algicola TaxID=3092156 RepID=A0ABZ0RIG3_9BACT|nr:Sip1-related alpha-galactosidase [Coraliomargarita sp. J2-16]WPJ95996.1 Sip1-related alpha-galactosidase [Coraliomargarita sp. J2-16]